MKKIQEARKKIEEQIRPFLDKLSMGETLMLFFSSLAHKIKDALKGGGEKGSVETSLKIREKTVTERLKDELRSVKDAFSTPKPKITAFRLGEQEFHPYSTSEDEEQLDSDYWVSLTSLFSAGRNIVQFFQSIDPTLSEISLENSEMYSLFPIMGEGILYVGRLGPAAMFSIKSQRFPRDRLNPPDETMWEEYEFEGVKIMVDGQLDLIFEEDETLYSQLSKIFRISYEAGVNKIRRLQKEGENFAVYLLKTPDSRFSPFITIRVGKSSGETTAHLFPTWFAYDELKLIRAGGELREVCKDFESIIEFE